MSENKKEKKLGSIGMITRNHAHCIRYALGSLLAQTYKNFELLILDGASEDNTQKICEEYAKKDKRIRYIRMEKASGIMIDFAKVLKEAKGEYFMWASDDDWWHPLFIESLFMALENNKQYGVAMCHFTKHFTYKYDPEKTGRVFEHNYSDKNYDYVYGKLLKARMNPIFLLGLYRREILNNLLRRLVPKCRDEFTLFLCEAALTTHFYSLESVLHSKYRDPLPVKVRHPDIGAIYAKPLAYTKSIFTILLYLLTSPNIPFQRKRFIFIPWFKRFWHYKWTMANELAIVLKIR